jgi:hypothetical protein
MTADMISSIPRLRFNWQIPRAVRLDILESAATLPGKSLHLLMGIWLLAILRQSATVTLSRHTMQRVSISRFAASDALRRLEAAGIVKVRRSPGRSSMVTILEPGTNRPLQFPLVEVGGRRAERNWQTVT